MNCIKRAVVLAGALAIGVPSAVFAGNVNLTVDKGTPGAVSVSYPGPRVVTVSATDGGANERIVNLDGILTLPTILNENMVIAAAFSKILGGKDINDLLKLTPPLTLAALEPFTVPSFAALGSNTPLVAEIDLGSLLSAGNLFAVGQNIAVTNGAIPQTQAITILNGSSLSSDPTTASGMLLDSSVLANLPLYTGSVSVASFDSFAAVPEPRSLVLFGIGASCMLGYACWHLRTGGRRMAGTK